MAFGPRLRALWPYLLVSALYLATSPYYSGLNNPNEMVRIYAGKAFVDHGSFVIDPVLRQWGSVDDKARRAGRSYSSKAPWQTLVTVPVYAAAVRVLPALGIAPSKRNLTFAVRFGSTVLPVLAFALVLLWWARRRAVELGASPDWGSAAGLSVALGTMLYPYALTATGHGWAAITAGGAHLALIAMVRAPTGSRTWRQRALLVGMASGIAPFAEYPAALAVAPVAFAVPLVVPGWLRKLEAVAWVGLGALPAIALGLWTHKQMWGSALTTGYAYLDNPSYQTLVDDGFFGVVLPQPAKLWGALFSPYTGLFFFSPVLLIGLAMLVRSAFSGTATQTAGRHRTLALTGLAAIVLLFAFIASHEAWRGGWTLGPRYIIPAAPILGLWLIEALAVPAARPGISVLGVLSLATTGVAAAIYPHLSDVFENPLAHFIWPTYLEGLAPYGIGSALGMQGATANLLHLTLLTAAAVTIGVAGCRGLQHRGRRAAWVGGALAAFGLVVSIIPEKDAAAADRERARLWSIWEPKVGVPEPVERARNASALTSLRRLLPRATVTAEHPDGRRYECRPPIRTKCRYGNAPWQQVLSTSGMVAGRRELALSMHPIATGTVTATFPVPPRARRLRLVYALTDGSIASGNPHPVEVRVLEDGVTEAQRSAGNDAGWRPIFIDVAGTSSVSVELTVVQDGARVFLFDGDFSEEGP